MTKSKILALSALTLALGASPARAATPSELYEQSYAQEAVRDHAGALETLEKLPPAEHKRYVFVLRKAWLQYLGAHYVEAIATYERAVALAPAALEPLLGLSLAQMAARRWLDADKTLQAVLRIEPNSYLGLSRRAWTQFNLGRYAQAEESYKRVIALFPSDIEMQAGLGWSLLEQSRAEEAKAVFEAVLRYAPRHRPSQDGLRRIAGR